jgi:hypothetical protein
MHLLDFMGAVRERFRPELPVSEEILEREKRFNEQDPSRKSWVLEHTYLCEGDLKALERMLVPYMGKPFAYYATGKSRGRKVVVSVPITPDAQATVRRVEEALKLDLHNRDCNSGVFYRHYEEDGKMVAEAVPAVVSGE